MYCDSNEQPLCKTNKNLRIQAFFGILFSKSSLRIALKLNFDIAFFQKKAFYYEYLALNRRLFASENLRRVILLIHQHSTSQYRLCF